jgi:predicted Rossmann-fold nucleotide-binding protein
LVNIAFLTWHQLGWINKPCGLLDVGGFYEPLMAYLRHLRDTGFVTAHHVERIALASDPAQLLTALSPSPMAGIYSARMHR